MLELRKCKYSSRDRNLYL